MRDGPDGLIDRKAPGPLAALERDAAAGAGGDGRERADPGRAWRGALADGRSGQWVWEEFRISISAQTISRELRALGYRKLSARPRHHAQAAGAIEDFKKTSRRSGGNRARAAASIRPT